MNTDLMRGSGGPPPQKNHKNIGFLSNTSPDPLKNHKATKLGHHRPTSEMPLNGVLLAGNDGPLLVLFRIGEHYF